MKPDAVVQILELVDKDPKCNPQILADITSALISLVDLKTLYEES